MTAPFELSKALDFYEDSWERFAPLSLRTGQELTMRFRELGKLGKAAFDRDTFPAHFTGSAIVVNEDRTRVLLTLHKKLGKWLQLGGHADGDSNLWQVALREAEEEGGLTELAPVQASMWGDLSLDFSRQLWDIDIHWIPERKQEPGHYHYDARFVYFARNPENIKISDESNALEWFPLERALELNSEWSMQRLLMKVQWWRQASN